MNQIDFSNQFDITQAYLSEIENGKKKPGKELIDSIVQFAESKGMSIDEIDVLPDAVNDQYHLYVHKDSDLFKTIQVTHYNTFGKYQEGSTLDIRKSSGMLIHGRIYVLMMMDIPHPIICRVYMHDDEDKIYIDTTGDGTRQTIHRSGIKEVYNIVRYVEKYL